MTRVYRLIPALALLLAAACGKDSPATPTTPTTPNTPTTPTTTNRAPSIGSMSVSPAFGISGLTTFTFVAAATDPDNDVLTYGWSFTGGSASGASTSGRRCCRAGRRARGMAPGGARFLPRPRGSRPLSGGGALARRAA